MAEKRKEEKIRKHIFFSGMVQGVGFRYRAYYAAQSLGLTGWVKNLWDGRVEMEIQGDEETISQMLEQLYNGRFVSVEKIESEGIPVKQESGFRVRG
ncbi:acylphosphatase [Lachnospiraceae bacterium 62-35]